MSFRAKPGIHSYSVCYLSFSRWNLRNFTNRRQRASRKPPCVYAGGDLFLLSVFSGPQREQVIARVFFVFLGHMATNLATTHSGNDAWIGTRPRTAHDRFFAVPWAFFAHRGVEEVRQYTIYPKQQNTSP